MAVEIGIAAVVRQMIDCWLLIDCLLLDWWLLICRMLMGTENFGLKSLVENLLHANGGCTVANDGLKCNIVHANGGGTVANDGLKSLRSAVTSTAVMVTVTSTALRGVKPSTALMVAVSSTDLSKFVFMGDSSLPRKHYNTPH